MPKKVKDLVGDQLRRIYRDYLKGVPKERLIKKYDLSEDTFWEIVGMYAKKKHPNDVGNAQDILGPADLLVTTLDSGSSATEHPIVARNPKDLQVTRERLVQEYDYDSPEEELRKKGGEVSDLVAKRNADTAEEQRNEAREVIKENLENTETILEELTDLSTTEAEDLAAKAAEKAEATPSPEDLRRLTREAADKQLIADQAAEANIEQLRIKHAEENSKLFDELKEAGEKQNEELAKQEAEARQKEQEQRAADHDALRKEAERAGQELAELQGQAGVRTSDGPDAGEGGGQDAGETPPPQQPAGSGQGTGSNQPAPSDKSHPGEGERGADRQGGGDSRTVGSSGGGTPQTQGNVSLKPGESTTVKAVEQSNTSPTDTSPNPVQPAKVEPDGLKGK